MSIQKIISWVLVTAVTISFSAPLLVQAQNYVISQDSAGNEIYTSGPNNGFFSSCSTPPGNFKDVVCIAVEILALIVPFLASLALLIFFWGIVKFIRSAGSEEAREEAKNILFWGLIGLFVMVSIWGIVGFFFYDLFGTNTVGPEYFGVPFLPSFPEGN